MNIIFYIVIVIVIDMVDVTVGGLIGKSQWTCVNVISCLIAIMFINHDNDQRWPILFNHSVMVDKKQGQFRQIHGRLISTTVIRNSWVKKLYSTKDDWAMGLYTGMQ